MAQGGPEISNSQLTLGDSEQLLEFRKAWEQALPRLQTAVKNSTTFDRWIRTLRPLAVEENTFVLGAAGEFGKQWVSKRYAETIAEVLADLMNKPVEIRFALAPKAEPNPPAATSVKDTGRRTRRTTIPPPEFVEKFTFDRFVQGPSNRLALAGARAVADAPGKKYNPLFIYGGPGLGKTHLLHAVGQEVLRREPSFQIANLTGQVFAEGFVHSVKTGRVGEFRLLQRSVDMWLVDDVQFIAGKERTQEELFHTFNMLYETGRQIVICSDRPPRELYLMEERLRSRFECGLVADISPPDFETRSAILIGKAEDEGITLPMDVVYLMADRIQSNIRTLEGSLCRLLAECSIEGAEPTVEMAEDILRDYFIDVNAEKPAPDRLIEAAARQYGVTVEEILGAGRRSAVTKARQLAMYLCRETWRVPWKQIGAMFDKDHTSALYAHRSIGKLAQADAGFQALVEEVVTSARAAH